MTENAVAAHEEPNKHNRRLAQGVPYQDLIEAVEIIGAHLEVPGSTAYRFLLQAAADRRVGMRDLARSIVEAPESLDHLRTSTCGKSFGA